MNPLNLLLIWVMFAVAAGSVAKEKNRNIYLWGALALLIGPFAILAVALMKPLEGADPKYH